MERCRCKMRESCGFMRQYSGKLRELAHFYGMVYCDGMKRGECKRLYFQDRNGTPPRDEMMPNGMMVPEVLAKCRLTPRPRVADRAHDLPSRAFPKNLFRVVS